MPFSCIKDIDIYHEEHGGPGNKTPIVMLHHGFGCTQIWKEIYPSLVENGHRVLMYDRRGYGRSKEGPDFMAFYVSDRFRPESVEEMRGLVTAMGINRFHMIGQCEGGVVAADYAARYPEQVKSMVISSTQCFSPGTMVEKNTADFPKAFDELEEPLQAKLTEWHGHRAESFYNQFRRFGGAYGTGVFDLRPVLALVQCPTLVLYPDRSSLFEVEQGVAMYRSLPKGELSVLPKCGHNTYQYRPDDYVRIALDFFARHEADRETMPEMVGMSCLAVRPD